MSNIKETGTAIILGGAGITALVSGVNAKGEQNPVDYSNCFKNSPVLVEPSPQSSLDLLVIPSIKPSIKPEPDGSFTVFVPENKPSFSPLPSPSAGIEAIESSEESQCYSFDFIYSLNYDPETNTVSKDQLLQTLNQNGPVILDYYNNLSGAQMTLEEFIEWHSVILNADPEVNDLGRNSAQKIVENVIYASQIFQTNKPVADALMNMSIVLLYYGDSNVDFRTKKGKKLTPEKAHEKMKALIKEYQELISPILSVD